MNIKELINTNSSKLSPQEKKTVDNGLLIMNDISSLSLKIISRKLNIQSSVVIKTLSKLGLVGFKNLKEHLEKNYYYENSSNDNNFLQDFKEDLFTIV